VYSETIYRSDGDRQTLLDRAAQAGAATVREPFDWANAQPRPGAVDFDGLDRLVGEAADRGLAVTPMIWNAPDWASTRPASGAKRGMYPPADPNVFGRFVAALVRRYGPGGTFWDDRDHAVPIRSWEIWNEPNFAYFWRPAPDPAAFARLLGASAIAIHSFDPRAEVIAGGLAPVPTARDYLHALLAAPGGRSFDTLAIHPYARTLVDVLRVLDTARADLDAAGLSDRGLAANEFGWATGGEPDPDVTVDEQCQAALIAGTLEALNAWRVRLGLRSAMQFMLYDRAAPSGARDLWALHTGLLRSDGSPKPAFDAYRTAARAIAAGDTGAASPAEACPDRTGAAGARPGSAPGAQPATAPGSPSSGHPVEAAGGRPARHPDGYAFATAAPDASPPRGAGPFDPRDPATALPVERWLTLRYRIEQPVARAGVVRALASVARLPIRLETTVVVRTGRRSWTSGPLAVELRTRRTAAIIVRVPLGARRAISHALRGRRHPRISLQVVGKTAFGPYQRSTLRIRPR
jgi:hypothetical protein